MNIASFFANKCFEFLLNTSFEQKEGHNSRTRLLNSKAVSPPPFFFPPPWVQDTESFKLNCDGCGKCLTSCENNILVRDSEGYPQVDFNLGECSFCSACAESCSTDAFSYEPSKPPWKLKAVITENCLSHNNVLCRTCAEHCEEEAIIIPKKNGIISAPLILAGRCTGCGACYSPCPAKAIEIGECVGQEKLPAREETG